MASVNLLASDNYALPKLVVTSNINIEVVDSTLYITTLGFGSAFPSSGIGTNNIYKSNENNTFLFRGLADGSYTSISATTTNLLVNFTGPTDGTNLSSSGVYAGISSNMMQFRGIIAGSFTEVSTNSQSLLVSYVGPLGNTAATAIGTNSIYAGASNNILQFRGIVAGSMTTVSSNSTNIVVSYAGPIGNTAATSISTEAVYAGASSDILQFRGVSAGSFTNVSTNTTLIIAYTSAGTPTATSISTNSIYTSTSNNILQFKGVNSGSFVVVSESPASLLVSYSGAIVSAATSIGAEAVYAGTVNNILQFRGIADGSYSQVAATSTTLIINYTGVGDCTSIGTSNVYRSTANNYAEFRGITTFSTLIITTTDSTIGFELPTTGVIPATYGSTSKSVQFTVDEYGRVTSATPNTVLPIVFTSTTLNIVGGITPLYIANLASGIITPGTYGSSSVIPQITVDTYGRITNVSNALSSSFARMYLISGSSTSPTTTAFMDLFSVGSFGLDVASSSDFQLTATNIGRLLYTGYTRKFVLSSRVTNNFNDNAYGLEIRVGTPPATTVLTYNYEGTRYPTILNSIVTLNQNDILSVWMNRISGAGGSGIGDVQMSLTSVT